MTTPTPKQRVLKRWPFASVYSAKTWQISLVIDRVNVNEGITILGTGPTPAAAWRNAAERMTK